MSLGSIRNLFTAAVTMAAMFGLPAAQAQIGVSLSINVAPPGLAGL